MTLRRVLLVVVAALIGLAGWRLAQRPAAPEPVVAEPSPVPAVPSAPPAATERAPEGAVWAMTFVRARPGQRERMERYLQANWLAVDELARQQGLLSNFRLLRADRDLKETWDFVVVLEYSNTAAMEAFVPAYLGLVRGRPRVRVEGLDFSDLGEIVLQKLVSPVDTHPRPAPETPP